MSAVPDTMRALAGLEERAHGSNFGDESAPVVAGSLAARPEADDGDGSKLAPTAVSAVGNQLSPRYILALSGFGELQASASPSGRCLAPPPVTRQCPPHRAAAMPPAKPPPPKPD